MGEGGYYGHGTQVATLLKKIKGNQVSKLPEHKSGNRHTAFTP